MELTQNLSLKKPAQEDFYDVDDFNANADILDSIIAELLQRGIGYDEDTYTLLFNGGSGIGTGSGDGSYILPVATKTRLGGVIIGAGIEIKGNGEISPDYDNIMNKVDEEAFEITAEEVAEMFK